MGDFAKRIRELREARNMTQKELAQRAGVSQVSIYMYEAGETTPKALIVGKLANALGVSCDELINGKE